MQQPVAAQGFSLWIETTERQGAGLSLTAGCLEAGPRPGMGQEVCIDSSATDRAAVWTHEHQSDRV